MNFKALIFCAVVAIVAPQAWAESQSNSVASIDIRGAKRTRTAWIFEYLELKIPGKYTQEDVDRLERKLLTTDVFSFVEITLVPKGISEDGEKLFVMQFNIVEKWTTIPVIRGAFGGGTPLRIFGIYDTHTLGKLWTLGAETRKYGPSPNSYVVWASAPRWLEGHHLWDVQAWRSFRFRQFFNKEEDILGHVETDSVYLRGVFMLPMSSDLPWQIGLDARVRKEAPTEFQPEGRHKESELGARIAFNERDEQEVSLLPRLVYDDLFVNQLEHDGSRFILLAGPLFAHGETQGRLESEVFNYTMLTPDLLFGVHGFVSAASSETLHNQVFLGGLDSVRGLPDGALHGNVASYANFELRHIMARKKYVWIQSASFVDVGAAHNSWGELSKETRTSAGLGMRFLIPQVYRLMFRIDYAWNLDSPGVSGVSLGLNQFFQPYKPLSDSAN